MFHISPKENMFNFYKLILVFWFSFTRSAKQSKTKNVKRMQCRNIHPTRWGFRFFMVIVSRPAPSGENINQLLRCRVLWGVNSGGINKDSKCEFKNLLKAGIGMCTHLNIGVSCVLKGVSRRIIQLCRQPTNLAWEEHKGHFFS